ncbi:MAG TPA: PRC-barrel domain-containing protein [Actinocrinis sp.]|nr:PRC-barrel domain-containing protein [Actinocrinis sp.]
MHATTPYVIGSDVYCADEVCGRLDRVVIDPVARELTHLVVEPAHRPDDARLVPVGLVDQGADGIRLRCDTTMFEGLDPAQTTEFLPAAADELGYAADHSLWLPYFPLGGAGGAMGPGGGGPFPMTALGEPRTVIAERVPTGEVQVRRGQPVHATDGEIGKVQGLVVDPEDHQVTHVLLSEGHLWGKKQVALPIRDVTDVHQGVHLDLSKDEIRELPPVDLAGFA